MATNQEMCGPCSSLDQTSNAFMFCTDCDDPLCQTSAKAHKGSKASASHYLIDYKTVADRISI